jgi:hypothetical protein
VLNSFVAFTHQRWRLIILIALLALYLALAMHQLGLPGLHYDEAAEAGVNAMELLTGAPVTAFRGVALNFFGRSWPLMVQDYIGALNVYLVLPALALTGIGVPNLRIVAVLTGLAALLLLERAVSEYWAWSAHFSPAPDLSHSATKTEAPLATAGLVAVTLLAASPSFVFWSRQGIFVTNLTLPLALWSIWQGVRWLRSGQPAALVWSAFAAGLALYAKLLAFWVVLPFALLAGSWWLWRRRPVSKLSGRLLLVTVVAFVLPLVPFLIFNWESGGTLVRITGNLSESYYGVDNWALLHNALIRGGQLVQTMRGDHFWYLGGSYGNWLAPWLAPFLVLLGLWRCWRTVAPPLLLLLLAFLCSLFTVSDLFITHYALIHLLVVAVAATGGVAFLTAPARQSLGASSVWRMLRSAIFVAVLVWLAGDGVAAVRYHGALARSGGLADHSDAGYHLAYHLRYQGLGAPIALDWGFAAPVRYLTEGAVQPIEIFGYDSLSEPDAGFADRLALFLPNADNVYLLHAPGATVFAGRREEFERAVERQQRQAVLERRFDQRDGTPLYELWRVMPADATPR